VSIVLYHSPSSSATCVAWALEELKVPYEPIKVDLAAGEQRKPEYLALNPNGKVPLLVVDGKPTFESAAQILVLGEMFGVEKRLFPAPGPARADAFQWLAWATATLKPELGSLWTVNSLPEEARRPNEQAEALVHVNKHLAILEAHLDKSRYLLGVGFSLVDCFAASQVPFMRELGVDLAAHPKVAAWGERCLRRLALGNVPT
jgi:glutathione S-transferase